jgi:hypothetical protein
MKTSTTLTVQWLSATVRRIACRTVSFISQFMQTTLNLGFNHGATLDDPLGILEGTGKQIRHIKIKAPDDLARPEIRAYLRRARKVAIDDARKLGEAPPEKVRGVVSTVKAIYPKRQLSAPGSLKLVKGISS